MNRFFSHLNADSALRPSSCRRARRPCAMEDPARRREGHARPRESRSVVVGPWGRCLLLVGAVGKRLFVVGAVGEEDVGNVGEDEAVE